MAGSLTVERFRITGLVPGDHPAPDRPRAAIERIDARRLAGGIAAALGEFGSDDGRVIVLRRLDLALSESRIGDADWLARQLAQGVAAAVARLATMQATETVAVFPSAPARMAAFAAAAARGDAWGRWWFSDLDDLKMLPLSSALRVALLRDPAVGLAALGLIAEGDRMRVATSLSAVDAAQLLAGLAPALEERAEPQDWIEAFAVAPAPADWPSPVATVHGLAVLASRGDRPLSRAALPALRLRWRMQAAPAALAAAVRAGSARAVAALAPDIRPSELAGLLALPAATRSRIARAIEESAESAAAEPDFTPFGGVLLLLPHFPEVDADALPEGPGDRSGLLALLGLASLFGRVRSGLAIADPVLRRVLGVSPRATQAEIADWVGRVPRSALPAPASLSREASLPRAFAAHRTRYRALRGLGLAALADFTRRLPGFASASLPFLRANLIGIGAHVLIGEGLVRAVLDRPPLDVLLSISGLADRSVDMGRWRLELERAS